MNHAIFKSNAYSAVYVNDTQTTFDTHDTCSLGTCHKGEGKKTFSETKSFNDLLIPHTNLHNHVLEISQHIKASTSNLLEEKEAIIALFKAIERESKELFVALDTMINEKNQEVLKK